jgi:hypothetical protein
LHKLIAIDFFRFLDVEFAVACDLFLIRVIEQSHVLHIERDKTKIQFHPLTDAIKDIYIPAQGSDNAKKFAYPTLMNMINERVIGMTSSQYRTLHNIDRKAPIREYMDEKTLSEIKTAETHTHGFIYYMKITRYDELKAKLYKESLN